MNKLKFETPDLTAENVKKIGELFPGVVAEGNVNFDLLRSMLGDDVFKDEAYEFTWVGKRAAIAEAGKPIRKTLRPVRETETNPTGADSNGNPYCSTGSKDWDTTENLYIEGDNLDALKLLQESYLGKVKMIYIDPPYNTGNDFIYDDTFTMDKGEYDEAIDLYDEDGLKNFRPNSTTNPRYHSDWCTMIYPRLVLARNLLQEDGVIFISIDDNEVAQLRKICDEVFGEGNFISQIIWQNKKGGGNDSRHIAIEHEYVFVYTKNKFILGKFYELYSDSYATRYREKDDIGKFFWDTFKRKSGKQYYPITCPDGIVLEFDIDGNPISWLRSKLRFEEDIKKGDVRIMKIDNKWSVQFKQRMPEGKKPRSIFSTSTVLSQQGTTSAGAEDIYAYFKKDVFSNPKPVALIKYLLSFGLKNNDIVLDFFSGSGTLSEAVMALNATENKRIKYIAIQLAENIESMLASSSVNAQRIAQNAISILDDLLFPRFITEIGKERIRRAGEKIKAEAGLSAQNLDIGFRVLKVDETNVNDVYYAPSEYTQQKLLGLVDNIKPDRTDMDLLFACLLDWGLPLSMTHTHEKIDGFTIHTYNNGDLIACFDKDISENVIRTIANRKPLRAVFRDNGFSNSPEKINVFEIFKLLAPHTSVKVI